MSGMSTRWEHLLVSLGEAGSAARVGIRDGINGTSRTITLRQPNGCFVVISDRWWHKNPDIWVGWEVWVEDTDSLAVRDYRWTKKRSEVVANVQDAIRFVADR